MAFLQWELGIWLLHNVSAEKRYYMGSLSQLYAEPLDIHLAGANNKRKLYETLTE